MSLHLLLDENISPIVAEQAVHHQPAMRVQSVQTWQEGAFMGRPDRDLLKAACAEGLTLVTYDQKTMPPLLADLFAEGESHAGVVFVDNQTIASSNFGRRCCINRFLALEVPGYSEKVAPRLKTLQPRRGFLRVDRCFNTGSIWQQLATSIYATTPFRDVDPCPDFFLGSVRRRELARSNRLSGQAKELKAAVCLAARLLPSGNCKSSPFRWSTGYSFVRRTLF